MLLLSWAEVCGAVAVIGCGGWGWGWGPHSLRKVIECTSPNSEAGQLLRRAIELRAALKLGFRLGLDEVRADEFAAMVILENDREQSGREHSNKDGRYAASWTGS